MSLTNRMKFYVMELSRARKVDHFYALCPEGSRILDVGVSSDKRRGGPQLNFFLKTFRYRPECYTGLGIEDLSGMAEVFPGKRFVQYPGGRFPFDDKVFDWVYCNAVIEHVGDDAAQIQFVNEMLRVSRNVFFTTPYKYFPVESHTNTLFLHWNDRVFYPIVTKRRPWITRENLYLFSHRRLASIMRASNASAYTVHKNRLFGLTMTLTVVCTQ